jgi:hypothetical protein
MKETKMLDVIKNLKNLENEVIDSMQSECHWGTIQELAEFKALMDSRLRELVVIRQAIERLEDWKQ